MSTETKLSETITTTETTDPQPAEQTPEATTSAPEKKPTAKKTTRKASAKKPAKAPAKARKSAPPSMPKKPVAKRPAKAKVTSATLADAAAGYLAQLEEDGASEATISSYRSELRLAAKHLGEDTLLAELTAAKVQAFFDCDAVTRTRDGRDKAAVGIAKTRRVLRQCLEHAAEKGLVEEAPLPSAD